jgi:hypothetical protein
MEDQLTIVLLVLLILFIIYMFIQNSDVCSIVRNKREKFNVGAQEEETFEDEAFSLCGYNTDCIRELRRSRDRQAEAEAQAEPDAAIFADVRLLPLRAAETVNETLNRRESARREEGSGLRDFLTSERGDVEMATRVGERLEREEREEREWQDEREEEYEREKVATLKRVEAERIAALRAEEASLVAQLAALATTASPRQRR